MAKWTRDTVYGDIKDRITAGEWASGEKVWSTSEFTDYYGIGSTAMGEVLRDLRRDGVLTSIKGGGYYVP